MAEYASAEADFPRLGLFSAALDGVSSAQVEEQLAAACTVARGYLRERYCLPLVWRFLPLAARAASGNGLTIDTFTPTNLLLALDITAIDIAAALSVSVQHSDDGAAWTTIGSFEGIGTTPAHLTISLGDANLVLKRYTRILWTLAGGNATFGVSWDGDDLKGAICKLAAYELLAARGLDPLGRDALISDRRDQSISWLKDVRAGRTTPLFLDQTPQEEQQRAYVSSRPRRRWTG